MNYLYNGKELPALPERDEAEYPHAYIDHSFIYRYVWFVSKPLFYDSGLTSNGEIVNYIGYVWKGDGSNWEMHSTATETFKRGFTPEWANTDLYGLDGTLYLAASDPIPVTTAAPIDPTSFMQGWLVGRRIAAMRGKKTEEV